MQNRWALQFCGAWKGEAGEAWSTISNSMGFGCLLLKPSSFASSHSSIAGTEKAQGKKRSSPYTRLAWSQVSLSLTLAHMSIYCHSHKGCLLWAPGLHKLPCPAGLFYPSVFAGIFFLLAYQHQEGLPHLSIYSFYGCCLTPINTCLFHKLIQNRSITPSNKPHPFFCTHFYLALINIPTMSHQLFRLILGTLQ